MEEQRDLEEVEEEEVVVQTGLVEEVEEEVRILSWGEEVEEEER